MKPFRPRTPLAWHNLTHNWRRLAVALAGIGFAVVLMFIETGFRNALFDSTVQILVRLDGELVLASKSHRGIISFERFDRQRIYQARGCAGVVGVYPVYVELHGVMWKVRGRAIHPIRLVACNPLDPVLQIPEVARHSVELLQSGTALFDTRSKPYYGVPAGPEALDRQPEIELCDRSLRLVGTFELGTDFTTDGNLILSDRNLARYCPNRVPGNDPLSAVDFAAVKLAPGADPDQVRQALARYLPGDMKVYTKDEFIAREIDFWGKSTPIG